MTDINHLIEPLFDLISLISLIGGLFFLFVGTVGLLRLPDVFNRLHATTKCDTLGAGLVLLSLAVQSTPATGIRLALIVVFIIVTNPTAAHVIARAAYKTGIKPLTGRRLSDD
ncbi:MAG: monovalent cation/H(+) antiporter subunit G [Dethiobacteria bacterium]